jgi:hypothetical protein
MRSSKEQLTKKKKTRRTNNPPQPRKTRDMKAIICLLSVAILSACSSTSKEVYTEKRTLKYPKGGTPHIKEMYLRNEQPQVVTQQPARYTGIDYDNQYVSSDVPYYEPSLPRQKSLQELHAENDMLIAEGYNKWLRNR